MLTRQHYRLCAKCLELLDDRSLLSAVPAALATAPEGEPAAVRFRLEVTDDESNPISEVEVGDAYFLRAFVQDVRDQAATGVFSAFLDVTFESDLSEVSGPVQFASTYTNGSLAIVSQPGLINEAGAFASLTGANQGSDLDQLGGDEFLVWTVPLVATSLGEVNFVGNPADASPYHDVYHYSSATAVPPGEVDYGFVSVTVVPPAQVILDDATEQFTTQGGWTYYAGTGFERDVHFHGSGDGEAIATWALPHYPGRYRIATTWAPHPNRATDAPYGIYAGNTMLDEIRVNQELVPNDLVFALHFRGSRGECDNVV